MNTTQTSIFIILLTILGWGMLLIVDWRIALGVFCIRFADNMAVIMRGKREVEKMRNSFADAMARQKKMEAEKKISDATRRTGAAGGDGSKQYAKKTK